jgi:anti-sigma factor RsiW
VDCGLETSALVSCEQYESLIGELVDGTLDGAPRHDLEHHLAACPACTQLAEELLVVRRAARGLPPLDPPTEAWHHLSARLAIERANRTKAASVWRRYSLPLAAAAVLVIAVVAGLTWRRFSAPAATPTATVERQLDPATASSAELLGSVEAELQQTEKHLETAVSRLEVLARDRQALDPNVAAELQKNLLVIDQAISESRAAVRTDPLSTQAQDSLFDAFRSKIALLQDTIALINEVRKGNQAEAARIADALNKS